MATIAILDDFDLTDYPNSVGSHFHKVCDCSSVSTECLANTVVLCKLDAGFADTIAAELGISQTEADSAAKTATTIAYVAGVTDGIVEYWRYV